MMPKAKKYFVDNKECFLKKINAQTPSNFINANHFQDKPYFGGHLVGHFEFLKTLNDASLA